MNTTDEGFSFSLHKNYKLGATYPRFAIFSLQVPKSTEPPCLLWGLKHVLGANLIPLRTKLVTQMKRVPAWPVINQLCFLERHFPANGISLSEVQMKFYERSLQALPFLCPSRLCRSLVRSRETRFARPNRRGCSQANNNSVIYTLSM